MSFKLAAVAVLALTVPVAAQAATYDAFASFNGTQGAGNFIYGFSEGVNSGFTAYGVSTNCFIDGSVCLQQAANHDVPGVTKSTTTSFQYGTVNVPDDRLLLHPGNDANFLEVVFDTPVAGFYTINALFSVQDINPTGVNVYLLNVLNNSLPYTLTPLTLLSSNNLTASYTGTLYLGADDYVGFAFDNAGSYFNDSTGLKFTISNAVPEPATWALMIGGFALVGAGMRRRKTSVAFA